MQCKGCIDVMNVANRVKNKLCGIVQLVIPKQKKTSHWTQENDFTPLTQNSKMSHQAKGQK